MKACSSFGAMPCKLRACAPASGILAITVTALPKAVLPDAEIKVA